eukprot:scaffold142054_cov51-Prasinocladus_malaysianus.AAC.2
MRRAEGCSWDAPGCGRRCAACPGSRPAESDASTSGFFAAWRSGGCMTTSLPSFRCPIHFAL